MDREHPVPQQISSYQFRLIGDMTIKQFFQVAGGALIAIIIYSSGLPSFVKWPIVVLSFLAGIAFAFFPLQDRPLTTWVYLFFKSIYSPTVFTWKKAPVKPVIFQPEPSGAPATPTPQTPLPQPAELAAQQQIQDIQPTTKESVQLEKEEQEILSKVAKEFATPLPVAPKVQQVQVAPPQKQVKEERIPVKVFETAPIKVEKTEKTGLFEPNAQPANIVGSQVTPLLGQKIITQAAKFSQGAAPPITPTQSNVIVGQAMDTEGNILENVILEIKDSEGRPARALKSNKLGHFTSVIPLSDGNYKIIPEKEGYTFEALSFLAKGIIIPPIAIQAKERSQTANNQQISNEKVQMSN